MGIPSLSIFGQSMMVSQIPENPSFRALTGYIRGHILQLLDLPRRQAYPGCTDDGRSLLLILQPFPASNDTPPTSSWDQQLLLLGTSRATPTTATSRFVITRTTSSWSIYVRSEVVPRRFLYAIYSDSLLREVNPVSVIRRVLSSLLLPEVISVRSTSPWS